MATTPRRFGVRPGSLLLAALALAALVLDAGSVPHVHAGDAPAYYNQEHDLSYLATFNTGAPLPVATVLVGLVALATLVAAPVVARPSLFSAGLKDSRAPPA